MSARFTSAKANGAGIAADPTLTSAWSLRTSGLATGLSRSTWRSMYPRFRRPPRGFGPLRFAHRRSHRHPVPSVRAQLRGPASRSSGSAAVLSVVAAIFLRSGQRRNASLALLGSRPEIPAKQRRCFRRSLKRSACLRPKPSPCLPQDLRGQMPLYRSAWKTPWISGLSTLVRRAFPRSFDD